MKPKKRRRSNSSEIITDSDEGESRPRKVARIEKNGHESSGSDSEHEYEAPSNSEIPKKLLEGLKVVKMDKKFDPVTNLTFEESMRNEESEVWLVKCQKDVDIQSAMLGYEISLKSGCSSIKGNKGYEVDCIHNKDDTRTVNVILPSVQGLDFKMVSKPLGGTIILQESLEEIPYPEIKIEEKKNHELPEDLKERHPVYGTSVSHISVIQKEKSKAKKSKHSSSSSINVIDNDNIYNNNVDLDADADHDYDQDVKIEKKKKKKRKDKTVDVDRNQNDYNFNNDNDDQYNKVEKKKKKHKHKEKVNDNDDIVYYNNVDSDQDPYIKKEKKKKHKHKLDENNDNDHDLVNGGDDADQYIKVKKKKKKKNKELEVD